MACDRAYESAVLLKCQCSTVLHPRFSSHKSGGEHDEEVKPEFIIY
jgi:hypothetical protein